ncbi:MAG: hypothetical protein QXG10_00550 [Candidatus Hadarchaeales archaeon]
MRRPYFQFLVLLSLCLQLVFPVPLVSGYGISYNGEASQNPRVPQGGSENIVMYVFNVGKDKGFFVSIDENDITITTPDGEPTPSEWWNVEVRPEPQIFEVDFGWKTENVSANFYIPDTDYFTYSSQELPEGFDIYLKLGDNRYALAIMVTLILTASENVPRGEYQLHVPFTGRENSQVIGTGLEVAIAYEAKPRFYVIGPPVPTVTLPPPIWVAIVAVGAFVCLTAVMAYKMRKAAKTAAVSRNRRRTKKK